MTERINAFLRSEAALLTLLAMALISQTPHTAVLFHRLSPVADGIANTATWLHAVAYAIALEFATLVFVVRGQRKPAWTFAAVSIGVNLLYYAVGAITPIYIMSALMVSVALPSSIAFYSHGVAEHAGAKSPQVDTADNDETAQDETPDIAQDDASLTYVPARRLSANRHANRHASAKAQKLTPAQRQAQILESGMDDAATIAAQFNVSMRTAQADIAATRDAITHLNGATEIER